jgi:hypothetical protein
VFCLIKSFVSVWDNGDSSNEESTEATNQATIPIRNILEVTDERPLTRFNKSRAHLRSASFFSDSEMCLSAYSALSPTGRFNPSYTLIGKLSKASRPMIVSFDLWSILY